MFRLTRLSQLVAEFDGSKRTCIVKLAAHNLARKQRYRSTALKNQPAVASSPVASASAPEAPPEVEPPLELEALLREWEGTRDPGAELFEFSTESLLASPARPAMSVSSPDRSLAAMWFKIPAVSPLDVPWGTTGARDAFAAGMRAAVGGGAGNAPPLLSLEGHIQPGCTLLTVDTVIAGTDSTTQLSAASALEQLMRGDSQLAAFLRRQPSLTLGLEWRGRVDAAITSSRNGVMPATVAGGDALADAGAAPLAALCGTDIVISLHAGAEARAAARMHGQTLPLRPVAVSGLPAIGCWTLSVPQTEGVAMLSFPASTGGVAAAPAFRSAPLLCCRDAAVVAEVLASAQQTALPAALHSLYAAIVALGHALRFDGSDALCSAELAAEGVAACFAYGWRAAVARVHMCVRGWVR